MIGLGKKQQTRTLGGVQVHELPTPQIHWYFYRSAPWAKEWALVIREIEWSRRLWLAVKYLSKKENFDVLETTEMGNFWSKFVTSLAPIIVRAHGNSLEIKLSYAQPTFAERLDRKLELSGLRAVSAISAPSQFATRNLSQDLGAEKFVKIIPNPLSVNLEHEAEQFTKIYSDLETPTILYTGRIEYRKGTLTLLEAMRHVVDKLSTARLVIVGGRHVSISQMTVEKLLDEYNLRQNVQMLGHAQWQTLSQWYRQASVFVMPSYYETFGISVAEAMAFGLPVVATNAGGLPEVVVDGETGILAPPKDAKALADALVRLLKDPALRERMGKAGRERSLSEFTSAKVACQTLSLYQNVLQRPS